ncbi:hypothetical protein DKP76_18695 [Falsochrobactrum shanghaiense]|uniref:Uncharacterized protein n=2 Tax=Falsochrobactrum shanghaiense TaxID=2201899 RepID=A0A316J3F2_9HYPH|nr:hypothetical protein DKP76_18695 [Falsochrobactrum shanghaiense]
MIAAYFAIPAFSQELPVYAETGTIDITFGDERITHYTTWNTVPNNPDREVHTASWLIMKPQLMGGVNISPDDVFVLITSRDTLDPKPGQSSLRVEISLNPETLELKSKPAASIRFHPKDDDSFYALTEGALKIESLARIDANSFAIVANAEGVMTGQNSDIIAHNPEDAVKFSARFDLQKIVNRGTIQLP